MTLEPAYQSLTAQLREVNTKFEIRGNGGIFRPFGDKFT